MRLKTSKIVVWGIVIALFVFVNSAMAVNWAGNQGFDKGKFPANQVTTDTTNFSKNLSSADTDVQKALETLDQLVSGGGGSYQPLATILTSISALSNAAGVLTNNGAGVLSWGAGGGGSMTWPAAAGIALYSGASTWSTSISGTSSQFVKGNGSLDSSTYLTTYTESDPVVKALNGVIKSNGSTISACSNLSDVAYLTSVTAHNLLSTTHGDTNAGSVVRGDIMYGNATPKWDRLAFPATPTGKVLQATATDVAWSSSALGTAAFTASTAYDAAGAAAAVTPTTLGLVIGTNVQAYNSNLTAINQALTSTSSPSFTAVTTNVTGNCSGTSATVTGAAQANITSVGTLTSLTVSGTIQSGIAGADGQFKLYSEQGATDYAVTLNPNAAMTSDANFYLPVDEPATTSFLNMTTGGVIGFVAATTIPTTSSNLSAFSATTSAQLAGVLSDESGSDKVAFTTSPVFTTPNIGVATATANIHGLPHHTHISIINPNAVVTASAVIPIWNLTDAALTVTKLTVSTSSASYEVAGDLKRADARIGLGNPAVMETFDTTSGVRSDTSIADGAVAAGKFIYLSFDSAPNALMTDVVIDIDWDYD